jgi:hypothetical protein
MVVQLGWAAAALAVGMVTAYQTGKLTAKPTSEWWTYAAYGCAGAALLLFLQTKLGGE